MTKKEIIAELCKLSAAVAERKFKYELPADCFCSEQADLWNYDYSPAVLEYMRKAITDKLEEDGV